MGQLRVHNKTLRRQLLLPVDKLGRRQNGNTQKECNPHQRECYREPNKMHIINAGNIKRPMPSASKVMICSPH